MGKKKIYTIIDCDTDEKYFHLYIGYTVEEVCTTKKYLLVSKIANTLDQLILAIKKLGGEIDW